MAKIQSHDRSEAEVTWPRVSLMTGAERRSLARGGRLLERKQPTSSKNSFAHRVRSEAEDSKNTLAHRVRSEAEDSKNTLAHRVRSEAEDACSDRGCRGARMQC
jgi:hypothetical protein